MRLTAWAHILILLLVLWCKIQETLLSATETWPLFQQNEQYSCFKQLLYKITNIVLFQMMIREFPSYENLNMTVWESKLAEIIRVKKHLLNLSSLRYRRIFTMKGFWNELALLKNLPPFFLHIEKLKIYSVWWAFYNYRISGSRNFIILVLSELRKF